MGAEPFQVRTKVAWNYLSEPVKVRLPMTNVLRKTQWSARTRVRHCHTSLHLSVLDEMGDFCTTASKKPHFIEVSYLSPSGVAFMGMQHLPIGMQHLIWTFLPTFAPSNKFIHNQNNSTVLWNVLQWLTTYWRKSAPPCSACCSYCFLPWCRRWHRLTLPCPLSYRGGKNV